MKPTPSRHFGELEAYRGLSAITVVVYHAYQHATLAGVVLYPGTLIGAILLHADGVLSLFFVLSGFVIFLPFARAAIDQTAPYSVRGFLTRRWLRILPLYFVAILTIWCVRYTGQTDQWVDLVEHLTFTQVFDQAHIFWTIGPAWSLAVEMMFYLSVALLGPLAYWIGTRCRHRSQRIGWLLLGTVLLIGASTVFKLWAFFLSHQPFSFYPLSFSFPAKLDALGMGMLLAVLVAGTGGRSVLVRWWPILVRCGAAGWFVWAVALRTQSFAGEVFFQSMCAVAMTLLLASTVLGQPGAWWERTLRQGPLALIGLVSYSLYLWHEPLLIASDGWLKFASPTRFPWSTLILLGVALLVAGGSYVLFEQPGQLVAKVLTRRGTWPARYHAFVESPAAGPATALPATATRPAA